MAVTNADVDRVAVSAGASVTLRAADRNRRGLLIHNETAVTLYVKCGEAVTSTDYSIAVPAGKALNFRGNPIYVGIVTGRLASGSGDVQVTEFYG